MHDLFDERHLRNYYEELGKVGQVTLYAGSLVGYPAGAKYFHSLRDMIPALDSRLISAKRLRVTGIRLRHTDAGVYRIGSAEHWEPLNNIDQAMDVCFAFGFDINRKTRGRICVSTDDRYAVANYIDFNDTTRVRNSADTVVWGKAFCHATVALAAFMTRTGIEGRLA